MTQHFQKAKELIERSRNVLLTMHERMDGDDGGSVLAMQHQLETLGKNVTSAIKKGVPPTLSFLPGSEKIADDIEHQNFSARGGSASGGDFDLLILFGCSVKDRTGSQNIINLKIPTINVDHHPDNTHYGDVNMVDPAKSSVAELVYDFFNWNGWKINKHVATCLLTGIITDTGSFMHSNTKASTLKAAADLMRKGAQTAKIIRQTYKNKNLKVLKAWGKALENSYYDPGNKIIFSVMTEKDLNETGELPQSAFEGLAETLNTVPQAKYAMFLRQDGEIIKGSLRTEPTKNVDVAKIAKLFGGGGHKAAAGFSVVGKLEKDEQGKWKVV